MEKFSREKIIGIAATVLIHAMAAVLLYFLVLTPPDELPEKGIEVILGVDDGDMVKARSDEAAPPAAPPPAPVQPVPPASQEKLMIQNIEESLALPHEEPKKPQKSLEQIQKEREEAERLEQERREREEAERIERERKEKEEAERLEQQRKEDEARKAAENSIANAFSKGNLMNKKTEAEKDAATKGSQLGNSETGQTGGVGVSFSLEGREPGVEGIVRPKEKLQAEGRVVVDITVNPSGFVIVASINLKKTNTVDPALREAALKAARKTTFNTIADVNNQSGTITYNFKLK